MAVLCHVEGLGLNSMGLVTVDAITAEYGAIGLCVNSFGFLTPDSLNWVDCDVPSFPAWVSCGGTAIGGWTQCSAGVTTSWIVPPIS